MNNKLMLIAALMIAAFSFMIVIDETSEESDAAIASIDISVPSSYTDCYVIVTKPDNTSTSISSGMGEIFTTSGVYSLTAVPAAGYTFVQWNIYFPASGNSMTSTSNPLSQNMYGGWQITPEFRLIENTCYLFYNANGGSGAPSTQTYTGTGTSDHTFTISSNVPTWTNHTFLGWSESSSASTASYSPGSTISVAYNGSKTLYAVWQSPQYTCYLYYNANGGSGAPSTQTYTGTGTSDHTFTISSNVPTWTNHTFLGWSESSSASTASYSPGSTISVAYNGSKTLYAVWQYNAPSEYSCYLYYNANGGTNAPVTQSYTGTSTSNHTFTISSSTPTWTDHVFLGWSESSSASTASYQPGSTISVAYNGSKTLYAVWDNGPWTCYVYFNANGGDYTPATLSYTGNTTSDHTFTIYASSSKEGYTFAGWSYTSGGADYFVIPGSTVSVPYNGYVTLTAVWYTKFTLNYDANGGSGAPASQSYTDSSAGLTHTFTITSFEPYRENFGFLGWSESSSASTATYQPGDTISVAYDEVKTLYAVWESAQTYTCYLYYDANGGTNAPPTQTYSGTSTSDHTFTISLSVPDRSGYSFGWWTYEVSPGVSAMLSPGQTVAVTYNGSVTLTAVWMTTCYLYYDANGGTNAPSTQSYRTNTTSDHTFTISSVEPVWTNYVFLGWSESSSASTASYQPGDTISVAYNGSKTLYAVWEDAIHYTCYLYYNANGGSGAPSTESFTSASTSDHTFTISSVEPVWTDHTFLGWSESPSAPSASYQPGDTISMAYNGSKTLYAIWDRVSTTVYWSNENYSGKITLIYQFAASDNVSHVMNIPLYFGNTDQDGRTVWNANGYVLQIMMSYPKLTVGCSVLDNGTSVLSDSKTLGTWNTFEIQIDSKNSMITVTPVKLFNSFTDYTLYDKQSKIVFDWSSVIVNSSMYTIEHTEHGNGSNSPKFSITSTDVFLDTYGVILNNPTINLYDYFPQYDSIRVNFYSFAIYGESITINGITYTLNDSKVKVQYVTDNGDNYLPEYMPIATVHTKVLELSNIYVTFDKGPNGHVKLTFVNDRFTIDLGAYESGDWTISMSGLWYFSTMVYSPYTATEKTLSDWKVLPETSQAQMLLIFLGILGIAGVAVAIHARRNGLGLADVLIIVAAAVVAFILLG